MIHTVSCSDQTCFEDEVNDYIENKGYKLSSSSCGYVGEVGNSVYDCDYWMAVLVKE